MKKFFFIFILLASTNLYAQTTNLRARNLNNVKYCDQFGGSDAAAKIASCLADLPSTGGVANAVFTGNQNWSTCPFTGVTKQVTLYLSSIHTLSINCTIPTSVNIQFQQSGQISVNSGKILTIQGTVNGTMNKHFAGSGLVSFSSNAQMEIYPEWWGAIADGVTDSTTAIQASEDALISGAVLNTIQNAPAGTIKFSNGTYLISAAISTCHFNACPGTPGPIGTINACVILRGEHRGQSIIFTATASIDMIQMYSWSCPSVVEDLYLAASMAGTIGIHVRGNQTAIRHNWFLVDTGIKVETTATIDTTFTEIIDNLFDATQIGGGPNGVIITRSGGTSPSPNHIKVADQHCYGGSFCIQADHLIDSTFTNVTHNGPGTFFVQLTNSTRVSMSNMLATGGLLNNIHNEDGIEVTSSTGVTISNMTMSSFPGPAFNCSSSDVFVGPFSFSDDAQDTMTAFRTEVEASNCDLYMTNGKIQNTLGNPLRALDLLGSGPGGSFTFTNILITGSQFTGTTVLGTAGSGGIRNVKFDNVEFRGVNSTGGATPDLNIGAVVGELSIAHTTFTHTSIPTNLIVSSFVNSNQCFDHNTSDGGSLSLNGVTFSGFTDGCFNGSTLLSQGQFANVNSTAITTTSITAGTILVTGGSTTAAGFVGLGFTTVGALPTAGTHVGNMIMVTDSTTITTEGQTCVGGSGVKALAVDINSVWKCF